VPAEEVLRNLPKLEVTLPALYVEGSGFGNTRYECVFLRLRQTDALTQLHESGLEGLPVYEGGELVGIVTRESIFRRLHDGRALGRPA